MSTSENEVNIKLLMQNYIHSIWKNLSVPARNYVTPDSIAKMVLNIFQDTSLVCRMDISIGTEHEIVEEVKKYMHRQIKLEALKSLPVVPQRSEEWLNMRKQMLTASDLAQAIGKGKFGNRATLLQKKSEALKEDVKPKVIDNDTKQISSYSAIPLKWGTMFEPMISRIYSQRNGDINIHEFGLIPHPSIPHFGASPDGITESGRMVEIKCPWKRKIEKGKVPEQYMLQIQGQLSVCSLDECDYIEVVMEAIDTEGQYYEMVSENATKEHGVILELQLASGQEQYEYSPINLTPRGAYAWAQNRAWEIIREQPDTNIMKIRPWKVQDSNMVTVTYDSELWKSLEPQIDTFWKEVLELAKGSNISISTSANEPITEEDSKKESQPIAKRVKKIKPVCSYRDDIDDETSMIDN